MEREEVEESAKAMDNFYRQNLPREDLALQNILQEISADYLKLNWGDRNLKEENKQLANSLKVIEEFEVEAELKNQLQKLQKSKQKFQNLFIIFFSLLVVIGLIRFGMRKKERKWTEKQRL